MGVDYSAQFGIGVKVDRKEVKRVTGVKDCMYEAMDELCSHIKGVSYIEEGSECYSGEDNEYYVIFDNPFDEGYDLTNKVEWLDLQLRQIGLKKIGPIGVVGVLLID